MAQSRLNQRRSQPERPFVGPHGVIVETHDERSFSDPTQETIARLFQELSEPGHFLRLYDSALGEVRAAGPGRDGTLLLQCDFPGPGKTFHGELSPVSLDEAVGIFHDFRSGVVAWSAAFRDLDRPIPRHVRWMLVAIALAALGIFASTMWRTT